MEWQTLTKELFDLSEYRLGLPQRSGVMTVIPIFGPEAEGAFSPPLIGLRLNRVVGYGNVELSNVSEEAVAVVPLHMGYIQDGAQNHALCRSALLPPGKTITMNDACCVQQSQGGYLKGKEQWFFILPLQLRSQALALRGKNDFGKLWPDISLLNERFHLPKRGHLEQIISRERGYLNQYQSRFELLSEQIGAIFFIRDELVGLEIAPTYQYFRELWMPLVCFCYGVAAMWEERINGGNEAGPPSPFEAKNLTELRAELENARSEYEQKLLTKLSSAKLGNYEVKEEDTYLNFRLKTLIGTNFAGQFVEEVEPVGRIFHSHQQKRIIYASIFSIYSL
ncbi:ARPP-1 family domain-containing protein [Thermoflavimicrobium dichotomicum]|uniref:ARG and Rhodanese-Phosphatase-superfamily-associated domain-containing protein n=1 Tax=Thermoflavimicrobium dichotomicum TaxID=46223 RepID=A0A1I3U167_9BACL|nr:DUF6569 family protein [Thermoflavimicrobium dichotomicum]SFJ75521.1 hypothetical protein SAMN05421852_12033 [Thermoflavimicrobium dichotomicum]